MRLGYLLPGRASVSERTPYGRVTTFRAEHPVDEAGQRPQSSLTV
jgi:hypothetical protein